MSETTPPSTTTPRENPLRAEKKKKLAQLRELGLNPFPHNFKPTHKVAEVIAANPSLEPGEVVNGDIVMAGRLMTKRDMGKAAFFNFQDQSGALQAYVRLEELMERDRQFFNHVDLGDWVGLTGFVFKTKKGELSLHCKKFEIISKTIEPLPEKFHGVADIEIKYRHRHLDLISDAESREVFITRSKIIREVRRFLDDRGFLEVETPVLQPIYGGAAAYPFSTHHRALDMKLFLKISPEMYLKRLIVGGFEKVYEIGKNFRNEGIDRTHNPEFMMLEYYEAYTDYIDQMKQFEELVSTVAMRVKGSMKVMYQGCELDFSPPWRRLSVLDGIREYGKFDPEKMSDTELFEKIRALGSDMKKPGSRGQMWMEAFELVAEEHLWNPTFIIDYPVEVSPLTKAHRLTPGLVERFEPICAGMELGNSYTELNDPEEQRRRLEEQEGQRVIDEEAQPMDEDFLHAIETGMPPTGGVGIGLERLVMFLTDRPSIRDIILFPTMRHK
jgi:lysyl-tRNA synthetase class 2